MKTAALLPTPGDPFLCRYWLANFRIWADEVDELVVIVNGQQDPEIISYLDRIFHEAHPNTTVRFDPYRNDHGLLLEDLVEMTDADLVMLCEDDCWVRYPGQVRHRFERIAAGEVDVIGAPRGCASDELIQAAIQRWGVSVVPGANEDGHGLWPANLFTWRLPLLRCRPLGAWSYPAGTYLPALDYTTQGDTSADTFVHASYNLRAIPGTRIEVESGYRLADRPTIQAMTCRCDPPWIHAGSLSSGYGLIFENEAGIALLNRDYEVGLSPDEYARRTWWWNRFEVTADDALPAHRAAYRASIDRLIQHTGGLESWGIVMLPLITWEET